MITEDYVSFEVAKLLKEKGFDEPCIRHWDYDDYSLYGANDIPISNSELQANEYNGFSAPSQSMAMKWLREVHNLSVEVYRTACGYVGCIVAIPSGTDIKFLEEDGDDLPSGTYTKWEYACEAALRYTLENLI